jgi:lipopolysaccharide/colanic/teichoic acid biosynthesis glycosyltransferase
MTGLKARNPIHLCRHPIYHNFFKGFTIPFFSSSLYRYKRISNKKSAVDSAITIHINRILHIIIHCITMMTTMYMILLSQEGSRLSFDRIRCYCVHCVKRFFMTRFRTLNQNKNSNIFPSTGLKLLPSAKNDFLPTSSTFNPILIKTIRLTAV